MFAEKRRRECTAASQYAAREAPRIHAVVDIRLCSILKTSDDAHICVSILKHP